MRGARILWAAAFAAALLAPLAASAKARKPRLYMPGDVFQAVLEAQDRQAWVRADVVKTETALSGGKAPTITKGHLVSKHGGKARLQIDEPAAGLLVADGEHVWMELPQVEQVMRYDEASLAASGNFFLDLASSIRHYSKASVKRRLKPGPGYDEARVAALEMVPTHPEQAGFERLKVWVDDRRWVVLRVVMDYGGTESDVAFQNVEVMTFAGIRADPGQVLPKDLFEYKPPKGFEVFDMNL